MQSEPLTLLYTIRISRCGERGKSNDSIHGFLFLRDLLRSVRSFHHSSVDPVRTVGDSLRDIQGGEMTQRELKELETGSRLKWTRLKPVPNVCIGILEHSATKDGHSLIH